MINYISALPSPAYAERWPRRLVVLGSTGSIGCSALDVVSAQPEYFQICALAGGKNVHLLAEQADKWRPRLLAVQDENSRKALRKRLKYKPEVLIGQEGYVALAALPEADLVLSAQVGAAGLRGTMSAVRSGKVVALANKESLVLAGDLLRKACRESGPGVGLGDGSGDRSVRGASILPVDSEHNAIFQCLTGQSMRLLPQALEPALARSACRGPDPAGQTSATSPTSPADAPGLWPTCGRGGADREIPGGFKPCAALKRIILTASGGPFRGRSRSFLERAGKADALAHPTWSMGAKITIDSATLMNKGLEVIEACHLFGLPASSVDVLVHPQSIVHSLIEYQDNSQLAQLGAPDMRIPISGCLGWPYRLHSKAAQLDLLRAPALTFEEPDLELFPALSLCRSAYDGGRGLSIALNAANEIAVILFMADKLSFTGITDLVARVLDRWPETSAPQSLEEVLEQDAKARQLALALAGKV